MLCKPKVEIFFFLLYSISMGINRLTFSYLIKRNQNHSYDAKICKHVRCDYCW